MHNLCSRILTTLQMYLITHGGPEPLGKQKTKTMIYLYIYIYIICIDKVYIDGPLELLLRWTIEKLSARDYFVIRKFLGPIVLPKFYFGNSKAQPYCICTLFLLDLFIRVSHMTHIFKTHKQNTGLMFNVSDYIYCI